MLTLHENCFNFSNFRSNLEFLQVETPLRNTKIIFDFILESIVFTKNKFDVKHLIFRTINIKKDTKLIPMKDLKLPGVLEISKNF